MCAPAPLPSAAAAAGLGSACPSVPADVLMQRRPGGRLGGVFVTWLCEPCVEDACMSCMEVVEGPRVAVKLLIARGVVAATLIALVVLLSLQSNLELVLLTYVKLWKARTCGMFAA